MVQRLEQITTSEGHIARVVGLVERNREIDLDESTPIDLHVSSAHSLDRGSYDCTRLEGIQPVPLDYPHSVWHQRHRSGGHAHDEIVERQIRRGRGRSKDGARARVAPSDQRVQRLGDRVAGEATSAHNLSASPRVAATNASIGGSTSPAPTWPIPGSR